MERAITVKCKDEDAELAKLNRCVLIDMSANGKYFIFSLSSRSDYRLFEVEKGTYRILPTFESNEQMRIPTVADNGDVFGAITYDAFSMGGMSYRTSGTSIRLTEYSISPIIFTSSISN